MAEAKNPIIAAVLSFVIPGVGQIYNGEMKKGLVLLGATVGSAIVIGIGFFVLSALTGVGGCLCFPILLVPLGIGLFSIYDAYMGAQGKPVWKFS